MRRISMSSLRIWVLLLFNITTVITLEKGDFCTFDSSNSLGMCTSLIDCQHVLYDLRIHNKTPKTCGFEGIKPLVCCTNPLSISSPPYQEHLLRTTTSRTSGSGIVGHISRRKCKEYSVYLYEVKEIPILAANPPEVVIDHCPPNLVELNIGGPYAILEEFPHLVFIGMGKSPHSALTWECSGSLISDLFILTAAHCLITRHNGVAQKVQLGTTKLDPLNVKFQIRRVVERITHPEYEPPSIYHDVGLIRLDGPVKFTFNIRPACLNIYDKISENRAVTTGFCDTIKAANELKGKLIRSELTLEPLNICEKRLSHRKRIFENGHVICANASNKEIDECHMTSGRPLQIILQEPYCMYSIIGVARDDISGMYTEISKYIRWIENIVWA